MPSPGCVKCANGEVQCGSDTSELCAAAGGWTEAGALCLQFFVRKHPKTGNCLIRVEVNPQAECAPPKEFTVTVKPPTAVRKPRPKT